MDHYSTAQGLALGGLPFKSIGLDDFDVLGALEKWVENDIPPDQIMAKGKTLDGTVRSRPLFPYPLFAKYISGNPNDSASFTPENDGTVRWPSFRKDTFYAFEILDEVNNPFVEGEGVQYFFPYEFSLVPGSYDWQVWSPSMDDEVGTEPGFFGNFEVE